MNKSSLLRKTIIGIIILIWIQNHVFWQSEEIIKSYTENIDWLWFWVKAEDRKIHNIFNKLCENIIKEGTKNINNKQYNPQESIFVAIVCNSIQSNELSKNSENKELIINKILKRKNFRDMWLICSKKQLWIISQNIWDTDCENRSFENNLDYPFLFQKTITIIQNDRVNLSLSRIYWASNNDLLERDLANAYITKHYRTIGKTPEAKNYPSTYKKLIQYIKIGKNTQKEAYTIDFSKIKIENIDNKKLPSISLFFLNNTETEISEITKFPTYNQINTDIMFNEIFFYTLFSSVYKEYLNRFRDNKEKIPISWKEQSFSIWQSIILQRWRIDKYNKKILDATQESIRQLLNLEASYPIHIGFLMYQEDLFNLRENLAKIYLPIHQLHYKLENVQSKN